MQTGHNEDLPLGLAMALAQNTNALRIFCSLPEERRQQVIRGTHDIQSKAQMREYVDGIAKSSGGSASDGRQ